MAPVRVLLPPPKQIEGEPTTEVHTHPPKATHRARNQRQAEERGGKNPNTAGMTWQYQYAMKPEQITGDGP